MQLTAKDCAEDNRLIATYLQRWKRYSLSFMIEAMQADQFWYPTFQQYEMCKIRDTNKNLAIRAGRGVGKTWFLACCILHHLICFRVPGLPVKVPITGPTGGQISDVVWAEIASALEHLVPWLRDRFRMTNEGLYCKELPQNWFASPRTARKEAPKSVQGVHGSTLSGFDEGSGIADSIFKVATSGMTERHARGLVAGNPDELSGYFYDIFHKFRKRWVTYGISCFDCLADKTYRYPYFDPYGEMHMIEVPGLVTQEYLEDQEDELGKDTPFWDAYVLGIFPKSSKQALIDPAWVNKAFETQPNNDYTRKRILGVDPGGNLTPAGLVQRRAGDIEHAELLHNLEPQPLADYVKDYFDAQKAAGRPIDYIAVDNIGIGAGVLSILINDKYPAIGVKSSESAPDYGVPCYKTRDWLWWQARSFFRDYSVHFCVDTDETRLLAKELVQVQQKKYKLGKVNVEDKEDLKKRGLKSPNLADALILTFKVDYVYKQEKAKKIRKPSIYRQESAYAGTTGKSWRTV